MSPLKRSILLWFIQCCHMVFRSGVLLLSRTFNSLGRFKGVQQLKFILSDYSSDYKSCLIALGILLLSMFFTYLDVSFALGCLHDISNDSYTGSFNILSFICFNDTNSRSGGFTKLCHKFSRSSQTSSSNFYRLPKLWNRLPSFDLSLTPSTMQL